MGRPPMSAPDAIIRQLVDPQLGLQPFEARSIVRKLGLEGKTARQATKLVSSLVEAEDYADALKLLAGVRTEVDTFFDEVMVMTEEPMTRNNRLALLAQLEQLMNRVADISKLAA